MGQYYAREASPQVPALASMISVSSDIIAELAPTGVLRAGINLSNFLLVTRVRPTGDPEGVAPDLASEIAKRLGVTGIVLFQSWLLAPTPDRCRQPP